MAETEADRIKTREANAEFNGRNVGRAIMIRELETRLNQLGAPPSHGYGNPVENAYNTLRSQGWLTDKAGKAVFSREDFVAMGQVEQAKRLQEAIDALVKALDPTPKAESDPNPKSAEPAKASVGTAMGQFKGRLRQTLAWLNTRLQ